MKISFWISQSGDGAQHPNRRDYAFRERFKLNKNERKRWFFGENISILKIFEEFLQIFGEKWISGVLRGWILKFRGLYLLRLSLIIWRSLLRLSLINWLVRILPVIYKNYSNRPK